MKKKQTHTVIDSRHLKVIAVKKDLLKDSLVLICINEDKYGQLDKRALVNFVEQVDKIEPDAAYYPMTNRVSMDIYDKNEFKNKDVIITIDDQDDVLSSDVEEQMRQVLSNARSIDFVYGPVRIETK